MKPEEIDELLEKYGLEAILGFYSLTTIEALEILDEHHYIYLSALQEGDV